MDMNERQYDQGYGPCLDGSSGGTMIEVPDMSSDDRYPAFTAHAAERGVLSSLTMPVHVQREINGTVNFYSRTANGFDDDSKHLAETLAVYAGVALANMHLYEAQATVAEQLQTAMQSRAAIEQAKGVLMAQRRCSPDEAFEVLVELSQRSNRKLREVAEALVEGVLQADAHAVAVALHSRSVFRPGSRVRRLTRRRPRRRVSRPAP